MKPTSSQLAMRDPAMAALLLPGDISDFGSDEFGDFGGDDDCYGYEFGYEFGADGGGAPSPQAVQAMWRKQQRDAQVTAHRVALIEPNRGSSAKIQRYTFNANQALVLSTPSVINATIQPDTSIRPQRVTMNAPSPGFATIGDIKVANVSSIVGGSADAFQFNANGVGQSLDLPTLSPANRATISGNYTGLVPPGFVALAPYLFCIGISGPASIVA